MNAASGDKAPALSSSFPPPSIASLQQRIWRLERSTRPNSPARIPAGHAALDRMLPDGGYLPGTLVEFVSSAAGDAAQWLSLRLVVEALRRGGAAVLVDPAGELYAPALVSLGIPLERLVLVQGEAGGRGGRNDSGWAFDQALRCPGVAAVWGALPTTDSRWLRRWQLAAEAGGTLGILLRPPTVLSRPTWSAIQWQVVASACCDSACRDRDLASFVAERRKPPGDRRRDTRSLPPSSPMVPVLPARRGGLGGEGPGEGGPTAPSGFRTPASGSCPTDAGPSSQPPPGPPQAGRSATEGPGGLRPSATKAMVSPSLPDWHFRLRLLRARRGAGREIDLRIDATSGCLAAVEPPRRQLGPIAPPPPARTGPPRGRQDAVA